MAQLRIEIQRDDQWSIRSKGEFAGTAEQVKARLPVYCLQNPHCAFLDGVLVAEAEPPSILLCGQPHSAP